MVLVYHFFMSGSAESVKSQNDLKLLQVHSGSELPFSKYNSVFENSWEFGVFVMPQSWLKERLK